MITQKVITLQEEDASPTGIAFDIFTLSWYPLVIVQIRETYKT